MHTGAQQLTVAPTSCHEALNCWCETAGGYIMWRFKRVLITNLVALHLQYDWAYEQLKDGNNTTLSRTPLEASQLLGLLWWLLWGIGPFSIGLTLCAYFCFFSSGITHHINRNAQVQKLLHCLTRTILNITFSPARSTDSRSRSTRPFSIEQ